MKLPGDRIREHLQCPWPREQAWLLELAEVEKK